MSASRNTPQRTADLIAGLAAQARPQPQLARSSALCWALALGLAGALLVVLLVAGARADLAAVAGTGLFAFKVGCTLLLAAAAVVLVYRAGVPGVRLRPWPLLLPLAVLVATGLLLDHSGYPLHGASGWSVARCVGTIVLAALPPLAAVLWALRRAIPTRPALAGALAGGLAGALAALAYTVACLNDGAAFVALWYHVAVLITALLGALLGRVLLRW